MKKQKTMTNDPLLKDGYGIGFNENKVMIYLMSTDDELFTYPIIDLPNNNYAIGVEFFFMMNALIQNNIPLKEITYLEEYTSAMLN